MQVWHLEVHAACRAVVAAHLGASPQLGEPSYQETACEQLQAAALQGALRHAEAGPSLAMACGRRAVVWRLEAWRHEGEASCQATAFELQMEVVPLVVGLFQVEACGLGRACDLLVAAWRLEEGVPLVEVCHVRAGPCLVMAFAPLVAAWHLEEGVRQVEACHVGEAPCLVMVCGPQEGVAPLVVAVQLALWEVRRGQAGHWVCREAVVLQEVWRLL